MTRASTSSALFLVDTGVFIRLLRGDARAGRLLDLLAIRGPLATSSIVVLEIFRGCKDRTQEDAAHSVLGDFEVTPLDYEVAAAAGNLIRSERAIFGTGQSVPDAIIAATAVHIGATLITLNTRQFGQLRVPELRLALIDQDSPDWRTPFT